MQDQFICPHCRAAIGIDDVNPATDIALCRSCGKTREDLRTPPKWVRVMSGYGGETVLRYRRISPILLFIIPFTLIWSGGTRREPKMRTSQMLIGWRVGALRWVG